LKVAAVPYADAIFDFVCVIMWEREPRWESCPALESH
jgi:hypothetical protein